MIQYNDNTVLLVEVKPAFRLLEEGVKAKITAGTNHAEGQGMTFVYWDEKRIFGWGYDLNTILNEEVLDKSA